MEKSSSASKPESLRKINYGSSGDDRNFFPKLSFAEWFVFSLLACFLAATNIYTSLLVGWGDSGSIIAVLASVSLLGVISRKAPSVQVLNLGQTMASAGGSIGFAVACYASVHIAVPSFNPSTPTLIFLFFTMGSLGTLIGSSVRSYMVQYFFPSGTVCAVIQTSVARVLKVGERNRPVWLLKLWGSVATVFTIPTKISIAASGKGIITDLSLFSSRGIGIAVDPLYYGIGIVVGPRIGIGMLIGALSVPFLIKEGLSSAGMIHEMGDWIKWLAIALLTLPTFATILFAYFFKTEAVVPSGFSPGKNKFGTPANRAFVYGFFGVVMAAGISFCAQSLFNLPWHISLVTIGIAWPLCVVNGRVTGDTDINPVRLVAIVLLSGLFWLFADHNSAVLAMLGMAIVGGTLAAVAVDMMQDFRTGYLVNANPTHQTTVQIIGSFFGAIASIPVLKILLSQLGLGEGSSLPAPGAQIWAAMAKAMAGGFQPSSELLWAILVVSLVGSLYAYFTVWPKTSKWMPSLFGVGIGLLVGVNAACAIFLGGLLKWAATLYYCSGAKNESEKRSQGEKAGNETMLIGASIFAAGALVSILLVLLKTLFDSLGWQIFTIAH